MSTQAWTWHPTRHLKLDKALEHAQPVVSLDGKVNRAMLARIRRLTAACCLAGLALLGAMSGCASLDLTESFPWPGSGPDFQVPNRMTDIWTYTVRRHPGERSVRGFGGRIMFFNDDDDKPIKVDGTLTVFAFDAARDDPARVAPEKKYVFLPEQFINHYSESKLGHSYSFWIPWDEVGGPQRKISLITRFESSTGSTVMSEASQQTLVGFSSKPAPQPGGLAAGSAPRDVAALQGTVRQVAHEELVGEPKAMITTTIDVPPSFARKVLAVGNGQASEGPAGIPAHAPIAIQRRAVRTHEAPSSGGWQAGPPQPSEAVPGPTGFSRPWATGPDVTGPDVTGFWPQSPTAHGPWDSPQQIAAGPVRPTRFAPRRFPARRASSTGPGLGPARRQPYRATWPSPLPPTPQSGWPVGSPPPRPSIGRPGPS